MSSAKSPKKKAPVSSRTFTEKVADREARREQAKILSIKEDGDRIKALRTAADVGQEEFAARCGVTRIAALRWESGQAKPSSQAWLYMAKLAGKVAPETALWFWEKAGFDREALVELFPEIRKLSREAEQRIRNMVAEPRGELTRVPLLRDPAHLGKVSLAAPKEIERWISLPTELISHPSSTFAVRISELFVRPIFSPGDIVVIDTDQIDIQKLNGALAAAFYVPDASTKRAADSVRQMGPVPASARGHFPHLPEGLYVGWLHVNKDHSHSHIIEHISINSERARDAERSAHSVLEFSAPVATNHVDPGTPGRGELVNWEESRLLGRVICWMSAPELAQDETNSSSIVEALDALREKARKRDAELEKKHAQKPGKK